MPTTTNAATTNPPTTSPTTTNPTTTNRRWQREFRRRRAQGADHLCQPADLPPRDLAADRPQPARDPAGARAAARRDDPTDHVHPAVPVRVRLRDPRPRH